MAETNRGRARAVGRAVGHVFAQIVVGIYLVVDSVLGPIFRPLMHWLSSLHIVQWVERGIASLPAYGVLALLAAPFAAEEVLKIYALVLMGGGHFKSGLIAYIGAHVFAILVCERIFHAGKDKLLTIEWFARLFHWLEGYKDRMVAWAKATDAYRQFAALKDKARGAVKRAFG